MLIQEESSQSFIAKGQTVRLGTAKLIHVMPSFAFFEFNKRLKDRTVRIIEYDRRKHCYVPIIILTGSAETPRETDISTSNKRPPIKIANATQSGLNHPYTQKQKQDKI